MATYSVSRSDHYSSADTDLHEVIMIADQAGNILNTFGAASNVIISAGDLTGYTGVHKFGSVFGTAVSSMSTVWTAADATATALYDWSYAPGTVQVVSTDSGDTTGVTVQGLDANYNFIEETFTLTGTTPVVGTTTFARVNRAFMNDITNIGDINVTMGATLVTQIGADYGQTLQAFYTVPAGKTAYLTSLNASAGKNQQTDVFLFQRPFDGAFRVATTVSLNQSNQVIEFPVPIKFNEKTDLDVRVRGSANATISCDYTIILVDNA